MTNLLHANLSRLFKNKIFLLSLAVMIVVSAALPIIHFVDEKNNGTPWTVDSSFFTYIFLVPILTAIVTSMFVGSEYSDGTLRNKLIVGHKRYDIYLSNLIVCSIAGIILCIAYMLIHICVGIPLLGGFESSAGKIFAYLGAGIALTVAVSAIFTLIAMLCQNKAYSVAACIILSFALLFAGIRIVSALNEPEYFGAYSYTENGKTVEEEAEKNPHYLSGTKREVYEFLYDFVPGGQVLQIANTESENIPLLALYDCTILIITSTFGILMFRRKDLK